MSEEKLLDLSWQTILKVVFTLFLAYLIFLIKEILILVLFAVILAVLFEPAIRFFQKFGLRRFFATILVYLVFFLIFAGIFYLLAKVLREETKKFFSLFLQGIEQSPFFLKTLNQEFFENLQSFLNSLPQRLSKFSADFFSAITAFFGGIFTTFTIFALAFFLSLEEGLIERAIFVFFPKRSREFIEEIWQRSREKVVGWFGVRILTCILVGVMVYLTCYFLDIEYGGLFALLAGVLDLIPILGPVLAGIPIIIFALFDSWVKAVFTFFALFLIQQIEGNILTPILTQKFLKVPPFLILLSLLAGGKLFGFLGAIFAIPLLALLFEIGKEALVFGKKENNYE